MPSRSTLALSCSRPGSAPGLREGVAIARDVIASGAPYRRLRLLVEVTND
jgi:anthranilate phosphoribosyltransferase